MTTAIASGFAVVDEASERYPEFEDLIQKRVASAPPTLFSVSTDELFDVFLDGLPQHRRQHYTCHCCRRFFDQYAGTVTVNADGDRDTLLWLAQDVPEFFDRAAERLRWEVLRRPIERVFLSSDSVWGTPYTPKYRKQNGTESGPWTHFSGTPPTPFRHVLRTANQVAAEKKADRETLGNALGQYKRDTVEQAVRILQADALDRSEKTLGAAKWFLAVIEKQAELKRTGCRDDHLWRVVATAPPGFCHVRSSMIGTLLDDLTAGMDFETVRARWAKKMHPLQYQRPTTVKVGNLERAEKVIASLKSAGALQRRFARLTDVKALWTPKATEAKPERDGVFGHLKPTRPQTPIPPTTVDLPEQTVTWARFARTVLPDAERIEVWVPTGPAPFYGLVTAVNPEAPPLLQWDTDPRNPVSWYFYYRGSLASNWGLTASKWATVTAIMDKPPHWYTPEKFEKESRAVFVAIEGCWDTRHTSEAGFFPECLRSEYHEIRSSMEAYAKSAVIEGKEEGNANGLAIQNENRTAIVLRVTGKLGRAQYRIDRLD